MSFFFIIFAQEGIAVNITHRWRNRMRQALLKQYLINLAYQTPNKSWLKYNVWKGDGKLPRW